MGLFVPPSREHTGLFYPPESTRTPANQEPAHDHQAEAISRDHLRYVERQIDRQKKQTGGYVRYELELQLAAAKAAHNRAQHK